ncbi:uncharacterized protein BDZ99DRAFT_555645 [Mytilinidion resinicola]|uniref:FAD-binding FR-type domain-containing protein n=1 Tax=Mytilinidion resinicola TaxID=574789 RepID=A0A6A6YVJ5_9PEZI|nr:uncharacterized protein BDZ99DRAFT_555645 [Mytilinidion resinicola]KAF2812821.1 hypothetical protein BDZ99DRAFT_555645 [Mytilinidion resinicola]
MQISEIYALAAGSVLAMLFVLRILYTLSFFPFRGICLFVLKNFVYPRFLHRSRLTNSISWYRVTVQAIYWSGTLVANFVRVNSISDAGLRAGTIAIVNFVPLLLATPFSMAANILGVSIYSYLQLHGSMAFMTVAQSVFHFSVILFKRKPSWKDPVYLSGLLAIIFYGLLLLLPLFRKIWYEIFLKTHYALALLAAGYLWQHVKSTRGFDQVYILVAIGSLVATNLYRLLGIVYLNVRLNNWRNSELKYYLQASRLTIRLPRRMPISAGQYIQLWAPGTSFWAFAQSHPFMISWWNHEQTEIHLLLQEQSRGGFVQKIRDRKEFKFLTWIDGPYGSPRDLSKFGTVFLIASDIGIAAQLPHVRQILQACQQYTALTRKLVLIWQFCNETDLDWIKDWMNEMIKIDETFILKVLLYDSSSISKSRKEGRKDSFEVKKGAVNVRELLTEQSGDCKGRIVVNGRFGEISSHYLH